MKLSININILSIFLLFASATLSAEESSNHVFKLPLLVPLTGSAAEQGQWILQGATIATEYLKENSGKKIELQVEDTQADPKNAISSLQKLKLNEKISSIITYGSGVGVSLSPIVNTEKIVQMGVATASPNYRTENDYTFRNFPSADLEAAFVVDQILNRFKVNEIALINVQNEYGVGTKNAIKKTFTSKNGSIIFEEELDPHQNDYRSIISKLKLKKPKLVYLASYPSDGAIFLRQAKELGLRSIFLAGPAIIGSSNFLELSKGGAEDLIISSTEAPFLNPSSELSKTFKALFEKKHGKVSLEHIFAARTFDAVLMLSQADDRCQKKENDCFKDSLSHITDFKGASGTINVDSYGDVTPNFVLMTIKNGHYLQLGMSQ